ncbi:MAG: glycosyltransferase family 39 protein [Gammaproteobacteria bacterium]|nr:glycosyltransferase family 39 protein [Gammaproteobacteria bacterium]
MIGNCKFILLALLGSRLLTLSAYPLMDKTEARYAEIARIMVSTGNWLTPYLDVSTPFWGKPPLSFWLSALSYKCLGVSEFSARLPMFLCTLFTLYLLHRSSRLLQLRNPYLPLVLYIASPISYLIAGAVMTDAALMCGVSLSLYAGLMAIYKPESQLLSSTLLGIGLAVGLLAKGPVTSIFCLGPLVLLTALSWRSHRRAPVFNWLLVAVLSAGLSLPWYLAAEQATPGFLRYFLLGEHVYRFLIPGWQGDLYGSAHRQPPGMIWIFIVLAIAPWILAGLPLRKITAFRRPHLKRPPEATVFLLLCTFIPLFFFSLTRNVLVTYIAPSLPALALLSARAWECASLQPLDKLSRNIGLFFAPLILISAIAALRWGGIVAPSETALIRALQKSKPGAPIVYEGSIPFSARFYSHGTVLRSPPRDIRTGQTLAHWLVKRDPYQTEISINELSALSRQHFVYWKAPEPAR